MAFVGKVTICKNCGKKFIAQSIADKYCCDECRKQAISKNEKKYQIKRKKIELKKAREFKEKEKQIEKD